MSPIPTSAVSSLSESETSRSWLEPYRHTPKLSHEGPRICYCFSLHPPMCRQSGGMNSQIFTNPTQFWSLDELCVHKFNSHIGQGDALSTQNFSKLVTSVLKRTQSRKQVPEGHVGGIAKCLLSRSSISLSNIL